MNGGMKRGTNDMAGEYEQFKQVSALVKQANRKISSPEDLERAILEDELQDAHEMALNGTVKMSVREYARFKGEQPQLIYYYIRNGYILEEPCICGRKVIDVKSADDYLAARDAKKRTNT